MDISLAGRVLFVARFSQMSPSNEAADDSRGGKKLMIRNS